ncbi:MAG: hypothetical protein EP330_22830 [Deltaproteobacteria bacterium]|nr:MAG: hypothetical protein EP330_22830 [Deltaproteobacteria bacterium]
MLAVILSLLAPAHAGSEVIMELYGAHLPLVETDAGAELSTGDALPYVLVAPRFRGIGPRQAMGLHWLPASAEVRLDPGDVDAERLRAEVSVGRYFGETYPVPVIYDIGFGRVRAMRDERLDLDLDLRVRAASGYAGFYFPSVDPGDFHGHIAASGGLLGFHKRTYQSPENADFIGAHLGGLGVDAEFGAALARGVILSAYLDCYADWSVGASDGVSLVTDSVVDAGASLRLGRHVALRLGGGGETTRDSATRLDVHYYRAYAKLRVGS